MSVEDVFETLDCWLSASWPLTREEVYARATGRLGWSVNADGYLENTRAGLSQPGVPVGEVSNPLRIATVNFWTTDVIRDGGDEAEAFLADHYTLLVDEGIRRWGKPRRKRRGPNLSAMWEPGGARVTIARSERSVTCDFVEPSYVQVLHTLGE